MNLKSMLIPTFLIFFSFNGCLFDHTSTSDYELFYSNINRGAVNREKKDLLYIRQDSEILLDGWIRGAREAFPEDYLQEFRTFINDVRWREPEEFISLFDVKAYAKGPQQMRSGRPTYLRGAEIDSDVPCYLVGTIERPRYMECVVEFPAKVLPKEGPYHIRLEAFGVIRQEDHYPETYESISPWLDVAGARPLR